MIQLKICFLTYGLRTVAVGIELIVNIHIHKILIHEMRMNETRSYRSANDKTVSLGNEKVKLTF